VRTSRSLGFAAYRPLCVFRKADGARLITVRGEVPTTRDAFLSETPSARIFEITLETRFWMFELLAWLFFVRVTRFALVLEPVLGAGFFRRLVLLIGQSNRHRKIKTERSCYVFE